MSQNKIETLNPAQMQAVMTTNVPCLVLAGAGSGKTRVISYKIARLVNNEKIPAKKIASITFTNKAAAEMRERTKALLDKKSSSELIISTFHSLGVQILRQSGQAIGLKPNFSIIDSDDAQSIIKDLTQITDAKAAKQIQWAISNFKNEGLTASAALNSAKDESEIIAAKILNLYQERLTAYQSVDFDDLIGLPLILFKKNPEILNEWQNSFKHILVDEYQDTNKTQYELLKKLVGNKTPFTAVGDDDQSIYGWRGATLENLKQLPKDFKNIKIIKLEQNYRCTNAILDAANNVIAHNPRMFEKKLFSEFGQGEAVTINKADNDVQEAQNAILKIRQIKVQNPKAKWSDFAILYRANHQAKAFEQAFRRLQMPYKVSGGQSFFDKAEIKDLCAWLRLWINENDDIAFIRAITTPKRGIGSQTLLQLGDFAAKYRLSLFQALSSNTLAAIMPRKTLDNLHNFARLIDNLKNEALEIRDEKSAQEFLRNWLSEIKYKEYIEANADTVPQAAARLENIEDFCNWVSSRLNEAVTENVKSNLLEVAQTLALISSISEKEGEQNQITLSTLHAAKGLEWQYVILAGVNEGILPFYNSQEIITANKIEEERRLMYVGITRARKILSISWLGRIKKAREMVMGAQSRFINDMAINNTADAIKEDPMQALKALKAQFAQLNVAYMAQTKGE